jgi:hypothetical protein
MSWTVRWKKSALGVLANLWMNANSDLRRQITAATNLIDRLLQYDPQTIGESREGDDRVEYVPPLGIRFEVNKATHVVNVLHTWLVRRRL